MLTCDISSNALPSNIRISVIYAKCSIRERVPLWDYIRSLASTNMPWIVGGDFNTIVNSDERIGGCAPNLTSMEDFANCIIDSGLVDIGFSGASTTWERPDGSIKQRLDRILLNHEFLTKFPVNSITHGVYSISDHRALLLN